MSETLNALCDRGRARDYAQPLLVVIFSFVNGVSEKIATRFGQIVANFDMVKSTEDNSNFHDFWTELIVMT